MLPNCLVVLIERVGYELSLIVAALIRAAASLYGLIIDWNVCRNGTKGQDTLSDADTTARVLVEEELKKKRWGYLKILNRSKSSRPELN